MQHNLKLEQRAPWAPLHGISGKLNYMQSLGPFRARILFLAMRLREQKLERLRNSLNKIFDRAQCILCMAAEPVRRQLLLLQISLNTQFLSRRSFPVDKRTLLIYLDSGRNTLSNCQLVIEGINGNNLIAGIPENITVFENRKLP